MQKNVILMILDGWGITQDPKVSAIAQANTPYIDNLYTKYPHGQLFTHGEHVGLPDGQMGNSEVGHMNLGAGRIVYQDFVKINRAVSNGSLAEETVLKTAFNQAKTNSKNLHFIGLVSDGGVHSHINHLKGLLTAAHEAQLENVYVHAFTDGRDVDPKSGVNHIANLEEHLEKTTGKLATIIGRYYAMDRDRRWERIKLAYDLAVSGIGNPSNNAQESIKSSYAEGITDEFIKPIVMTENGSPIGTIKEDDVVIFFNFRTDRGRQLTQALSQKDMPEHQMQTLPLHFVTLTNYDATFKGIQTIFNKDHLSQTLGEVLSSNGKTQIRMAETEKYPHVTFFFSGGREAEFEGEKRILCASPKVATYDLQPEMSAGCLRDHLVTEIKKEEANFICINFANPDMVGHTGSMQAAIKACEMVDQCVNAVVDKAIAHDYTTIIIADHGNSETMINPDGSPHTAHTTNPVPIILVDKDIKQIKNGILGDIAPTVLDLMGVDKPQEMTQNSLL